MLIKPVNPLEKQHPHLSQRRRNRFCVNKSPTPGSCNTVSIQEPAERNEGVFSADRAVPEVVSVPHTQAYATVCAQFKSFLEGHEEQITRSYAIAEVVRKNGDKRRKRAIDDFNESISLSNLIFLSLLSAFKISSEFWLTLNVSWLSNLTFYWVYLFRNCVVGFVNV